MHEGVDFSRLIVYHRGEFRSYGDAQLGLMTHAFLYGTGCFEGIRAFWNDEDAELYVFEPDAHYRRLQASGKVLLMDVARGPHDLTRITAELCRRNGFRCDVYIRPLLYKSEEAFGVRLDGLRHELSIVAFPNAKSLESARGLNVCVSSWRRLDDNAVPPRAKLTGGYINSALVKTEAQLNGFDEAILLTDDGHVSETSVANIIVMRDGVAAVPPASCNALEGITRTIALQLLKRTCGVSVVERPVDRTELYSADEVIFCGTGIGVAWVASVDHRTVGDGLMGGHARALSSAYADIVRGRDTTFAAQRHAVYGDGHRGDGPPLDGTDRVLTALHAPASI
jgi:branched-chain amino acid aminotransferase